MSHGSLLNIQNPIVIESIKDPLNVLSVSGLGFQVLASILLKGFPKIETVSLKEELKSLFRTRRFKVFAHKNGKVNSGSQ